MIMMFRTEEGLGPNGKAPSAEAVTTPCRNFPVGKLLSWPVQFRHALSALPVVLFYTWQNRDGDRAVLWAWKE